MAREKRSAADPVRSAPTPGVGPEDGQGRDTTRSLTRSGRTLAPTQSDAEWIRNDLLAHARHYDFFYAVGMMERLYPDAVRVGGNGPYHHEAIRFCHDEALSFSPGDVARVTFGDRPRAPEERFEISRPYFQVTTAFLGLTGSVSPLPLYFAEEIAQAQDHTVERDFLDVFHHRLISMVYRVGVKHDLAREYSVDASDAWSRRILALAGFDLWGGRRLEHLPLWRMLRLAPLLAARTRSARVIATAIEDACEDALQGARVRIEQFRGDWTPLDAAQRMALGVRNHALGRDAVLGQKVFDRASRAVIVIETLTANFRRFLGDGDMFPVVLELVHLLSPEPITFELDLVINERARPRFELGRPLGGRLGVDAWLSSGGGGEATHLRVQLPSELPKHEGAFGHGWQSKPQR